jgi:hypothetical protein
MKNIIFAKLNFSFITKSGAKTMNQDDMFFGIYATSESNSQERDYKQFQDS